MVKFHQTPSLRFCWGFSWTKKINCVLLHAITLIMHSLIFSNCLSFKKSCKMCENSEININPHPFPTVYFHKNYLTCISLVKPASCDGCLRRDDSYYCCFVFRNYSCSIGRSRMGKAAVRLRRATPAYRRFRWSIRNFSIYMCARRCACVYVCTHIVLSCFPFWKLLEIKARQQTIERFFITDCGWKKKPY